MKIAILPFLEYLFLQFAVAIIGLNVVKDKVLGFSGVLKSWAFGQMLLLAVFQILAVPMIYLRSKFDTLFWSYVGIAIILLGLGAMKLYQQSSKVRISGILSELKPMVYLLSMVVILLILWQGCDYIFGKHLDEDDARFLAQANDAMEYGEMLTIDFDTGEFLGYIEPVRDVTSPWTMMIALVSRLLFTKPAIFAHTIYPPVALGLMYAIYWLIGKELFKKKESQLSVVLLAIIVNLFFTVTGYTQSTFSLIRIWQGKATVAAVIVPMLIYLFICLNKSNPDNVQLWIMVIITGCAACLMSGAGIPLSLIAVMILGFYSIVAYRQWKRIPFWIASMVPPLGSGLLYMFLKG